MTNASSGPQKCAPPPSSSQTASTALPAPVATQPPLEAPQTPPAEVRPPISEEGHANNAVKDVLDGGRR